MSRDHQHWSIYVTAVRPNNAAGLLKKMPSQYYILQMASWETLPILKEALVEVTMGHSTTHTSVFILELGCPAHL
jgi:hypothetical protein